MNYLKQQIRRISRNRMILFGILFAYLFLLFIALLGSDLEKQSAAAIVPSLLPSAVFLFFFILSLFSYLNYTNSASYKRLCAKESASAETVNMSISKEVESEQGYSHKKLKLTNHWVLLQYPFSIRIEQAEKLVWVYRRITKTNYGATYNALIFSFLNQKQYSVTLKNETDCAEIMRVITQKYPYVLTGYSKELFYKYKNDLNSFINIARQNTNVL